MCSTICRRHPNRHFASAVWPFGRDAICDVAGGGRRIPNISPIFGQPHNVRAETEIAHAKPVCLQMRIESILAFDFLADREQRGGRRRGRSRRASTVSNCNY
jgi:hypothetical protein